MTVVKLDRTPRRREITDAKINKSIIQVNGQTINFVYAEQDLPAEKGWNIRKIIKGFGAGVFPSDFAL